MEFGLSDPYLSQTGLDPFHRLCVDFDQAPNKAQLLRALLEDPDCLLVESPAPRVGWEAEIDDGFMEWEKVLGLQSQGYLCCTRLGHTHPDGRLIGPDPFSCSVSDARANLVDCVFREIDPGLFMIARAIWPSRELLEVLSGYLKDVDACRAITDTSCRLAETERLNMEAWEACDRKSDAVIPYRRVPMEFNALLSGQDRRALALDFWCGEERDQHPIVVITEQINVIEMTREASPYKPIMESSVSSVESISSEDEPVRTRPDLSLCNSNVSSRSKETVTGPTVKAPAVWRIVAIDERGRRLIDTRFSPTGESGDVGPAKHLKKRPEYREVCTYLVDLLSAPGALLVCEDADMICHLLGFRISADHVREMGHHPVIGAFVGKRASRSKRRSSDRNLSAFEKISSVPALNSCARRVLLQRDDPITRGYALLKLYQLARDAI